MGFGFKSKPFPTVRGGSGKMVGKQTVGTRTPGVTSPGGKAYGFPMKGGKGKMVGKGSAKASKKC